MFGAEEAVLVSIVQRGVRLTVRGVVDAFDNQVTGFSRCHTYKQCTLTVSWNSRLARDNCREQVSPTKPFERGPTEADIPIRLSRVAGRQLASLPLSRTHIPHPYNAGSDCPSRSPSVRGPRPGRGVRHRVAGPRHRRVSAARLSSRSPPLEEHSNRSRSHSTSRFAVRVYARS